MQFSRAARQLLGLLAIVVASGCVLSGRQGDPAAPVLVRGIVVDAAGQVVPDARLQLSVRDWGGAGVGETVEMVFTRAFTAGSDGRFEIRLTLVEPIRAYANDRGEAFVNFDIDSATADEMNLMPFAFSRDIAGGTWAGEVPDITIGGGAAPGEPAPQPEG